MLEFFRRHRGAFLITLTIIIIASLFFFGGARNDPSYQRRAVVTDVALTVHGKDITIGDVQRAQRSLQFSYMYLQSFDLPFLLNELSGGSAFNGPDSTIINLFVARHLMEEYGIRPSDAEARAALEQVPSLQTDGKFDLSRAQRLSESAGSMGFESSDILRIMKDTIGLRKLQELVAGTYTASPLAAEKQYASNYHTIKGSKITFETEAFEKAATVSEDEIKKYYDENKENYKTEEKRAVDYVFFENPKDLDKKPLEERQKAQNGLVERVNQFNNLTRTKPLKEAAAETKDKVESLPAFTEADPPAVFKGETDILEQIFAATEGSTPEAMRGANGWYVFAVSKIEQPRQQELAEVKDKIKKALISQKASEALTKAVNDARNALNEGLKAGKKIEDVAKEKNLKLEALPDIDIANPPQDVPNAFLIAQQGAKTAPNSVSNAIPYDKGTLLVYVRAKELRKRPDSATVRQNQVDSLSQLESRELFRAWFKQRYEEAKVKTQVGVS